MILNNLGQVRNRSPIFAKKYLYENGTLVGATRSRAPFVASIVFLLTVTLLFFI